MVEVGGAVRRAASSTCLVGRSPVEAVGPPHLTVINTAAAQSIKITIFSLIVMAVFLERPGV